MVYAALPAVLCFLIISCKEPETDVENSETLSSEETTTTEEVSKVTIEVPEQETESQLYPIFETLPANASRLRIILGESRTVGMARAMGGNSDKDIYIAEGGVCYTWFRDKGFAELSKYLDTGKVSAVFFNTGVNDVADCVKGWKDYDAYTWVEIINQMVFCYTDVRFYFVAIGPVTGDYHGTSIIKPEALNPAIKEFNQIMYERCFARYIDVDEYMEANGFSAPDGVHYSKETYKMCYDYMMAKAEEYDREEQEKKSWMK